MSESLFDQLRKIGKLPTPPGVVLRLLELSRKEDVSMREIANTVGMDPALSAKILKFANSPMAGLPRQVNSLQQAVALVGLRGVSIMALSFSLVGKKTTANCPGFDHAMFWSQSLACGVSCRALAAKVAGLSPEEAFVGGLLSQIGRTLLAAGVPQDYAKVLAKSASAPRDLPPLEREVLGETYATIGARLLEEWGLPDALTEAISIYRSFNEGVTDMPPLARLLNAGEIAASILCPDSKSEPASPEELCAFLKACFGIEAEETLAILHQIANSVEEARELLEMPKGNLRSPEEIEAEVRERVAELSIAVNLERQCVQQENEELTRRATTDQLTGLKNRAAFDEMISLELERAGRSDTPLTLLMLDVDRFKVFNDTYGHQAGDRVLQTVAEVLRDGVRRIDFVARYGGEEFAIIAPDTELKGGFRLAERLREGVEEQVVEWEGQPLCVTVSIGVATFTNVSQALRPAAVIKLADAQLYRAKTAGRNRVEACVDGEAVVPAPVGA
ncbi:MAG: GGDEF domain-containing protein [Phycisphaerales bacterium]|nr:MAG: GGDEF domain-containing protein [Phycisphaerales bacterium]